MHVLGQQIRGKRETTYGQGRGALAMGVAFKRPQLRRSARQRRLQGIHKAYLLCHARDVRSASLYLRGAMNAPQLVVVPAYGERMRLAALPGT